MLRNVLRDIGLLLKGNIRYRNNLREENDPQHGYQTQHIDSYKHFILRIPDNFPFKMGRTNRHPQEKMFFFTKTHYYF